MFIVYLYTKPVYKNIFCNFEDFFIFVHLPVQRTGVHSKIIAGALNYRWWKWEVIVKIPAEVRKWISGRRENWEETTWDLGK